jgi:hypothetical protein
MMVVGQSRRFGSRKTHRRRGGPAAANFRAGGLVTSATRRGTLRFAMAATQISRATGAGSDPMSIFGNIMSAIFSKPAAAQAAPPSSEQPSAPGAAATTSPGAPAAASPGAPAAAVDVEAILNKLAEARKERLDWRKSIVDLMKLLDLDSSLAARKQLAQELKYSGDTNDSAKMNIWLHKQVMIKLAENGGKVPSELKH